jgi:hypothetical protein
VLWPNVICLAPHSLIAFAFYPLLSYYFCCARSAHAWFTLSLLHAHELPLFHLCFSRWFWKMMPMSLWSGETLQMNSWKDLWLVSKRSSRRRLHRSKVLGLIKRINLKAPATARLSLTMVVAWRFGLWLVLLAWAMILGNWLLRRPALHLWRALLTTFRKDMADHLVWNLSRIPGTMKQWCSKTSSLLVSACLRT